ncbi:hypothetical protein [Selenomonas ruminis]|uniref:hypothetical protein n=1 Tax=Selenomonas ruminis TaxID=2593411 RepID=UPI0016550878|nr:hypothetical protein [Selenomonas sp. mPRGC5]
MIYTVYAKHDDMTFIMEEKTGGGKRTLSVVGFYFGEPDDSATKEYTNSLTAEFDED